MRSLTSTNEDFKILQFTDLHLGKHKYMTKDSDIVITKNIVSMIKKEKPQLIVFTGDTIDGEYCNDAKSTFTNFFKKIDELKTHWAFVFGNHGETGNASKEELLEACSSFKYCLSEADPESVYGVANFHISIKDNKTKEDKFSLFFLDYGSNNKNYHFDWIHKNQTEWFKKINSQYNKIPAYIFFHVPVAEFKKIDELYQGKHLEDVDSSIHESNFFDEMVSEKNIIAMFCGHEHYNNYCTKYKGINLCYGQNSGFDFYNPKLQGKRGARIINIDFKDIKTLHTRVKLFPLLKNESNL